jgi:predicted AlkP superfamily phosphohydrolase/phosphomutase
VKKRKVLVIGLDGATFDLIYPWAKAGKLPHIKKTMSEGTRGELYSTIPPISAAAWTSFLTGRNPANHGIFAFRTYDLSKYSCYNETLVNSSFFAGTTIADYINLQGLSAGLISLPITYPPWTINGFIIAGFPTPRSINYSYPPDFADKYGRLSLPTDFPIFSEHKKIKVANSLLEARLNVTLDEIKSGKHHFIAVVFNNSDIAHHHFWHTLDSDNIEENIVLQQYQIMDQAVGRLLESTPDDYLIIIMSDHGGGPSPIKYFNTNFWLSQMNWLAPIPSKIGMSEFLAQILAWMKDHIPLKEYFKRYLPRRIRQEFSFRVQNISLIDWSKTKAYRVPMSPPVEGIHINVKSRQPKGIIREGPEYEELRNKIIQELQMLKDPESNQPLVTEVYKREEIYSGRYMNRAPDIVFFLNAVFKGGAGMKQLISPVPKYDLKMWSGNHTMNGIFIACNSDYIKREKVIEGAQIIDLAPTILFYMGFPIPNEMDGKVLTNIFSQDFLEKHPIRHTQLTTKTTKYKELTKAEEDDMRKKLKGLGYLS